MREMKDSGIEWIGEIPKRWEKINLKYICDFKTGGTPQNKKGIDVDGDYKWITPADFIESYRITDSNQYISAKAIPDNGYTLFPANSVLLVCIASVGKVGIIDKPSYSNQQITALKPNNLCCSKYLMYSLVAAAQKIQFDASSNVVPIVNTKYLQGFTIPFPTVVEQRMIANFLDAKCAEIDALTADIQTQIDTLEQYKRSVITEAVTKGLNPDVEMKDSENQYWGNIPTNWHLSDIKYLFEIVKRIAGKEGYDILSVTQKGIKIKDISNNEGQVAESYANYQFVYPGDFVMNHMDLLTGWVDCSKLFGVTSPDYRVFRLRDKNNSLNYYKYIMQTCYMNRIFYSLGQGVSNLGRWRLQTSSFSNFMVPVPPVEFQESIANYLDKKCAEINDCIGDKQKQLEILVEYKKSLIYEYVTGKKEVPDI